MSSRGLLIAAVCVFAVLCGALCGCAKKNAAQKKAMAANSQSPAAAQAAKSKDIFDEFYDNAQGSAADAAAKGAQKTFSTSPSNKSAASVTAAAGSTPSFSENGNYSVQISTVGSELMANHLVERMREKSYPAYVARVENPTPSLSGLFYRVRIGGFATITDAKSFAENSLVTSGYEYWIDNRSNDNVGMEGYGLGAGQPASTYQNYGSSSSSSSSSWSAPTSTPSTESTSPSSYTPSATTETSTPPATIYDAGSEKPSVSDVGAASSAGTTESGAAAGSDSSSTGSPTDWVGSTTPSFSPPPAEPAGTTPSTTTSPASGTSTTGGSSTGSATGTSGSGWTDDGWGDK